MATAGRTMSPGGALLRASRMFSLPTAIPPPPGDYQAATSYNSETATQGFPTLQTVTAPETFRQRGDWGFKRNFPMRSTARTSTPYLRIKQVDSIEHVTDFASAADHTLTLEKWQEMNIPISLPHTAADSQMPSIKMDMRPQSVFEDKFDFTAIDEEKISKSGHMRWKYEGPWLAKLTEGEFQKYIKKLVRPRRSEFRQYLRENLAPKLTQRAKLAAQERGGNEVQELQELQPSNITDDQITDFLRELRNDRQMLFDLVGKFLDLAPIEPPEALDWLGTLAPHQSKTTGPKNPYAVHGPPITHPSAGLSYLRTGAFLENHPIYGPLKEHRSIKARVVNQKYETDSSRGPKVGVGGIIASSNMAQSQYRNTRQEKFDPTVKGGSKLWVNISSAQVNSQGRVLLTVDEADGEARLVQEEMQGETRVFHAKAEDDGRLDLLLKAPRSTSKLDRRYPNPYRSLPMGTRQTYGMGN